MFKLDKVLEEYLDAEEEEYLDVVEEGIFSTLKDKAKNTFNNLKEIHRKRALRKYQYKPRNPMPKEEYEKEWKPKIDALINKVKSEVMKLSKNKKYKSIVEDIYFDTDIMEEQFPILICVWIKYTPAAHVEYDFMNDYSDPEDEFTCNLCRIIDRLIDKSGIPAHSDDNDYGGIFISWDTIHDGIEK